MPSVLIELGYVSDEADLKQLVSGTWQAKAAGAVAQSVDAFFGTRMAGAPAAPSTATAAVPKRAGR